jgi:hypothetical protein
MKELKENYKSFHYSFIRLQVSGFGSKIGVDAVFSLGVLSTFEANINPGMLFLSPSCGEGVLGCCGRKVGGASELFWQV